MTLLIALPGPHPALATAMDAARDALPALEHLLQRARRLPPASDWRAGLLGAVGLDSTQAPEAALAARALPSVRAGAALCLAAPLHVVAGMSRVHLPPGGWLSLGEEAAAWCAAFNAEFGGPDLQLHNVAGGWLLVADCAAAARDAAPEQLVGEPLARAPAADEPERALRRLGAEVEMWLSAHPLNRAREARGLPVLNCLWFWGGARVAPLPPVASAPQAFLHAGECEPWFAGLAAHCGVPALAAADWQSLPVNRSAVLALPAPRTGVSEEGWRRLDASWFAPAAAALDAGSLPSLRLQIGTTAWQLPGRIPWRWLRRRRAWHRLVAA